MGYISQEEKKRINLRLKPILKEFGLRATLSIRHHSTLELNIWEGPIDFPIHQEGYSQVNVYHIEKNHEGQAREFLIAAVRAMRTENWFDKSDLMSDYHHVAYYVDINIGRFDKPYIFTGSKSGVFKDHEEREEFCKAIGCWD